jgi:hypothetical protein
MRTLFLMPLLLVMSGPAFANCYVLQNNTDSIQTWHFQYAKPLPGEKTDLKLAPHARFPANRDWCWETPSDYYATVRIDAGGYVPSWQGVLVFGNGSNASPSGTYSLEPTRRTSAAPLLFSLRSVGSSIGTVHRRSDDLPIEYADVVKAISS